ncbi:hypothetical protein EGB40_03745 [Pasteurella multocida]|uniref:hypothetical protein n=1 Tax=Pasteurella multocida TaxID=747 RepID=UPI001358C8F4|nr:hypothetical protein [Pasteurella multocida]NAT88462.1 hypothetical protein [Pasteurella multocida]
MKKAIFEILRSGSYHFGDTLVRNEDIKSIVTFYDKNLRTANAVIGHPKSDEPKHGEALKLYKVDGRVFAEVEIDDELIGKIKNGEISGISCGIFRRANPENPIRGIGTYLKHIGFLLKGKEDPAIKEMIDPRASIVHLSDGINFKILDSQKEHIDKAEYLQTVANITYKQALNLINN